MARDLAAEFQEGYYSGELRQWVLFHAERKNRASLVTNLPSLWKRALPAVAMAAIAAVLFFLPRINALTFAHMHYEQCSDLVQKDSAAALKLAREWRAARPDSPMARHCEAMALFASHDYARAGDDFAALAKDARATSPVLAARLLTQAARAYSAGTKYDQARNSLTTALTLKPDDAIAKDLLIEINKENSSGNPSALAPAAGTVQK